MAFHGKASRHGSPQNLLSYELAKTPATANRGDFRRRYFPWIAMAFFTEDLPVAVKNLKGHRRRHFRVKMPSDKNRDACAVAARTLLSPLELGSPCDAPRMSGVLTAHLGWPADLCVVIQPLPGMVAGLGVCSNCRSQTAACLKSRLMQLHGCHLNLHARC